MGRTLEDFANELAEMRIQRLQAENDQYREDIDQYRLENDQYRQEIALLKAQLAAKG